MGEDPGQAIVSNGRSAEQVRREIEAARAELGATVHSLAEKANVKARAKERVSEIRHNAGETLHRVNPTHIEGSQVASAARGHSTALRTLGVLGAGLFLGWLVWGRG